MLRLGKKRGELFILTYFGLCINRIMSRVHHIIDVLMS